MVLGYGLSCRVCARFLRRVVANAPSCWNRFFFASGPRSYDLDGGYSPGSSDGTTALVDYPGIGFLVAMVQVSV
jgi:hypothetical protein